MFNLLAYKMQNKVLLTVTYTMHQVNKEGIFLPKSLMDSNF